MTCFRLIVIVVVSFLLLLLPLYLSAQDSTIVKNEGVNTLEQRQNWYWAYGGLAPFVDPRTLMFVFGANVAWEGRLLGCRMTGNSGGDRFSAQGQYDISAYYGMIARSSWNFASIGAGVGYTSISDFKSSVDPRNPASPPYSTSKEVQTVGFVVQMEAGVKFYVIGFGVNISLNVNPIRSFGTYSATLCLGWFP